MARKLTAEFIGTLFLVAAVVGSGIMAERLSPDDVGLQLFENAFATAGALLALILALGPVSGAHFNPVVSAAEVAHGRMTITEAGQYAIAQISGGAVGAITANLMFALPAVEISEKSRAGFELRFAEVVATIGLLLVIYGVVAAGKPHYAAATVAGYIGGAYFFTASTSFANPAVTLARMLSDTFAGIRPVDAAGFIAAQIVGGLIGIPLIRWLFGQPSPSSPE